MAVVLPLRSERSDWGLLALVGTIQTTVSTGREELNQIAAMLTGALDHQAVLESLRQQREQLADAVLRERELLEGIRVSEERYALAAEAGHDGLWDWNLSNDTAYFSPRCRELLNLGQGDIGTGVEDWFANVDQDDLALLTEGLSAAFARGSDNVECELRVRCGDSRWRWLHCRALALRDGVDRVVGALTDVTERKELEEQLRHDALYDPLTGLPNRTLLLERLDREIEHTKRRPDYTFAVLFLDVDGFKVLNDSLGHLVGDQLLEQVAHRLTGHLRSTDTAARFGGDEFAVLLHDVTDPGDLPLVAEKIQEMLAEPFTVGEHEIVVSASIGIASSVTGYDSAADVLRDADTAMYRAKSLGKGTYATFDVTMHHHAVSRLRIETELRRAIENGELRLHYQPIVHLDSRRITGFEALVRWRQPGRGDVPLAEFLPVAEETGLIIPIGRWILAEACRQLREWRDIAPGRGQLRMSVNVSHRQFWHSGLLDDVNTALTQAGLAPTDLKLEITEGVIMHNPEDASVTLRALHDRGVELEVDDFGTGYSSLEALHRFPIEALKIDRSFVSRIGIDERSTELVRTMVMMGRSLQMKVVAEGIEHEEQRQLLNELDCDFGQGYLFSRPVSGDVASSLLLAGPPA